MKRQYLPHLNYNREKESPVGEYRVALGLTVKEFCEKTKIDISQFCALQNGLMSPINNKTGEIKPWVTRICDFLGVDFADLFPRYACKLQPESGLVDVQIDNFLGQENKYNPEDIVLKLDLKLQMRKILATLTPREEKVLRMYFGIEPLDYKIKDIADDFLISRMSIQNIISKALRKLRHPTRSRKIKVFWCEN